MNPYSARTPVVGLAALTLLESLLIALRERDVLSEQEMTGLKDDVVAAHRHAALTGDKALHNAVADLVAGVDGPGNGLFSLRTPKGS